MSSKKFFSLSSVKLLLKDAAPGDFTPESMAKAREISEDLLRKIAFMARQLATRSRRKRITESDIKLASEYYLFRV